MSCHWKVRFNERELEVQLVVATAEWWWWWWWWFLTQNKANETRAMPEKPALVLVVVKVLLCSRVRLLGPFSAAAGFSPSIVMSMWVLTAKQPLNGLEVPLLRANNWIQEALDLTAGVYSGRCSQ